MARSRSRPAFGYHAVRSAQCLRGDYLWLFSLVCTDSQCRHYMYRMFRRPDSVNIMPKDFQVRMISLRSEFSSGTTCIGL